MEKQQRKLQLQQQQQRQEELEAERECMSLAFRRLAEGGAGLGVLKALCARGAYACLKSVACGGSEEALEWAAAEGVAARKRMTKGQRRRLNAMVRGGSGARGKGQWVGKWTGAGAWGPGARGQGPGSGAWGQG